MPDAAMLGDALHCLRALGSDEDAPLLAAALHALGTSAPAAEREAIVRARAWRGRVAGRPGRRRAECGRCTRGRFRAQPGRPAPAAAGDDPDLRVVPILLARQLARMRRMDAFDPPERGDGAAHLRPARAARQPARHLAIEVGTGGPAFRALEPDTYQRIARLLDDTAAGASSTSRRCGELAASLVAHGIEAEVAGRPKHIYSIWRKMQKKGVPIGETNDLRAARVLVGDVPACYAALGVAHALWTPVPGESTTTSRPA